MPATAFMQYTNRAQTHTFRWSGGDYIDVGNVRSMDQKGINGDDFHAYDVIDVWGRAPSTLAEFEQRCAEYIAASK